MSLIKQTNEKFMEQQGKKIFDMEISHNVYFLNKKYYEKMSENQKEILKTIEKDDLKKFKTLLKEYIKTAESVDEKIHDMLWKWGSDCNYSDEGIKKLKENVKYNIDIIDKIIKGEKEEPKPKKEEPKKKPAKVESESESEEEDDEEEYDKEIKKLEEKILKAKEKKEREEKKKRIEEKKAKIAQLKKQLEELEK